MKGSLTVNILKASYMSLMVLQCGNCQFPLVPNMNNAGPAYTMLPEGSASDTCARELGMHATSRVVDGYASWCLSYRRLADCIQRKLDERVYTPYDFYLSLVFDAESMIHQGKQLCIEYPDLVDEMSCMEKPDIIEAFQRCYRIFWLEVNKIHIQSQHPLDTDTLRTNACKATLDLTTCYQWAARDCYAEIIDFIGNFEQSFLGDPYCQSDSGTKSQSDSKFNGCLVQARNSAIVTSTQAKDVRCMNPFIFYGCLNDSVQRSDNPLDIIAQLKMDPTRSLEYMKIYCSGIKGMTQKEIDGCTNDEKDSFSDCVQLYSQMQVTWTSIIRRGSYSKNTLRAQICSDTAKFVQCHTDVTGRKCSTKVANLTLYNMCASLTENCAKTFGIPCPLDSGASCRHMTSIQRNFYLLYLCILLLIFGIRLRS